MDRQAHVITMYDHHPISAEQIFARLERLRGSLDGLKPHDLFDHDQDHYGGLDANRLIAERAGFSSGDHVVDFCAGLGGPARWYAANHGVRVTGIELNAHRVADARALTEMVGLSDAVAILKADVTRTPLAGCCADAVISQEAFLHVPDKAAALKEATRLLKPGRCLVFTDWVRHRDIDDGDADVLWRGLGAQTLQTPEGYGALIADAGLETDAMDDLTGAWAGTLTERFAMYTALVEERRAAGLDGGDPVFCQAYERLVSLVASTMLGGVRIAARKPG